LFVCTGFVGTNTQTGRQTRGLAEERPKRELCPKLVPTPPCHSECVLRRSRVPSTGAMRSPVVVGAPMVAVALACGQQRRDSFVSACWTPGRPRPVSASAILAHRSSYVIRGLPSAPRERLPRGLASLRENYPIFVEPWLWLLPSYAARALECAESTARELAGAQALGLGEVDLLCRDSIGPGVR
jgi:hypothetical protein